jgi:tetratricopeptide (TPR) repeat protein
VSQTPTAGQTIEPARTVPELAAAIASYAQRSDQENNSRTRADLAAAASRDAEACLTLEPQAAACLYGHGVALGLEARAHPTRSADLLKKMLASLASAEALDPDYDDAGPARVSALVLVRAPGWPLGPGDADAGLAAARRAIDRRPQYPPNSLALAEALRESGDSAGARKSYERARDLARALPPSADRDDWLRQADEGLHL